MRKKMTPAERAKQFMPFSALKGYEEVLRKKERIPVPKASLSEDAGEILDWKLHQIKVADMITVVYYDREEYVKKTGMVSKIDPDARLLKIVNTKILFEDIYDIQGESIQSWRMG